MSLSRKFIISLVISIIFIAWINIAAFYVFYSSNIESYFAENIKSRDNITIDYINSVVVVDLGEKYKGVNIGNSEITNHPLISIKDTEHMFPFQVLQPLPHGFFGSIIMSSEVSKPYPLVSGTGGIVLPLQKVDFSDFENPTVNLSWDMDKLLEVYDNNTPDDVDDDVITFNLSNPFQ